MLLDVYTSLDAGKDMTNSFRLKTPRNLYEKLVREFKTFSEATNSSSKNHKFQSDIAFNFCITAWHIVDWIWAEEKLKNPGTKPLGFKDASEYGKEVMRNNPSMEICYELAIGSKHFSVDRKSVTVVTGTGAKVRSSGGIVRSPVRSVVRSTVKSPLGEGYKEELYIKLSDGRSRTALDVFNDIMNFWENRF